MKVALAGRKDSLHISHFGRADFFRIYELAQGRQELLDIRFNQAPCPLVDDAKHGRLHNCERKFQQSSGCVLNFYRGGLALMEELSSKWLGPL